MHNQRTASVERKPMFLPISDNVEQVLNPWDLRSLFRNLELLRSAAPGDGEDGGDDGDDDGDEDEGDDGSGGTGQDKDEKVQDPEKKRLSDEAARYRRLRREERERREAAEERLRELENKDKDDSERLSGDLKVVTEERDDLKSMVGSLAKEVAIARAIRGKNIADPDYLEHLLDKSKVEYIDEDGEINDIRDVVEDLLKKKPGLVVATSGDEDDDEEDEDGAHNQPSGSRTNGKKKSAAKNGTDFSTLAKKYPALARR